METFPTLYAALAHRAAADPDQLAYEHDDSPITWRELDEDAAFLAAGLIELGVRRGDHVALLLRAGIPFIRLFWAVQRIGAVPAALNPFAPAETAIRRASRIHPRLIVEETDVFALVAARAGLRSVAVDAIPRVPRAPNVLALDPDAVAYLQSTSGTSGEPRVAMVRHRNVSAYMRSIAEANLVNEHDRLAGWVPPWHDLGLVRFIMSPAYFATPCFLITPAVQTIPRWLAKIGAERVTITSAPDFAYRLASRLVDPRNVDLSSLRYAANGGEPVRRTTIEAFEERFRCPGVVLPGYGMAETTLGVTQTLPGDPRRFDERGNASCGRPMPGVEVRVDDSGEVLVRSDTVFAGYFEAEEATREALREGWLHTGDVGHLDADGHLYILGRKRALIKRGGAALAPRELEEVADGVPGVKIAAAVGVPAAQTEEIVLAVELKSAEPVGDVVRAISEAIQRALGFAPDRILVVKQRSIPRTYNGKVRHAALREELLDGTLAARAAILFNSADREYAR